MVPTASPTLSLPAETAVARFFKTLKHAQRKLLCFPIDHPRRFQVQNNWAIVRPTIADLSSEQQALCKEIFRDLCSDEGYERFMVQMGDDYGGFERYHVAVFGEPGTDRPFEWVLTGRHNTLRADGNVVVGGAFGGPIFYGHAADSHYPEDLKQSGNVWWYQGEQAHQIFSTLDDRQRARALVIGAESAEQRSIRLQGDKLDEPGLAVGELDGQQKQMVQRLLRDLTRPFRSFEVEEVQGCLRETRGTDTLRLTYFKEGITVVEGGPEIWRLEGRNFAWYFHGTPHVHAWINVVRQD